MARDHGNLPGQSHEAMVVSYLERTCRTDRELLAALEQLRERSDALGAAAWQVWAFLAQVALWGGDGAAATAHGTAGARAVGAHGGATPPRASQQLATTR
jgi:hypothetical protein